MKCKDESLCGKSSFVGQCQCQCVCLCVCVCVCMCVFAMHVCTLGYVQEVMQLCLNVCRVLSDFNFS